MNRVACYLPLKKTEKEPGPNLDRIKINSDQNRVLKLRNLSSEPFFRRSEWELGRPKWFQTAPYSAWNNRMVQRARLMKKPLSGPGLPWGCSNLSRPHLRAFGKLSNTQAESLSPHRNKHSSVQIILRVLRQCFRWHRMGARMGFKCPTWKRRSRVD